MTGSLSTRSLTDAAMEEFVGAYHDAADKQAVVRDFCGRVPILARDFRDYAAGLENLLGPPPAVVSWPNHLPGFQIIRKIGEGGMGRVYKAWQSDLKRFVAIKIRRGTGLANGADRFLREQEVLARLHQSHIVPIHTAGQEGPWQYFAMAFIDGAPLHKVIRKSLNEEVGTHHRKDATLAALAGAVTRDEATAETGPESGAAARAASVETSTLRSAQAAPTDPDAPAPPDQPAHRLTLAASYYRSVAQLMADAAEALAHAHEQGILHRDIKPSNIMVDTAGQCWLIDFGLAYWTSQPEATGKPDGKPHEPMPSARTHGMAGTPEYMAPEQHMAVDGSQPLDARTDVYGLGVTLYELLTLRRAFTGRTLEDVRAKVLAAAPVPLCALAVNVPADLAAICARAMHKESAHRYATALDLAEDLRRWMRLEPTVARPARTPRRMWLWSQRNPGWATAVALAVLLSTIFTTILGGLWAAQHERNQEAHRQDLMRQAQHLRLSAHRPNWREEAWRRLGEAASVRADDTLRNEAATTMIGLDAEYAKQLFDGGASALAFDSTGTKLVMGAHRAGNVRDRKPIPAGPIRIWDMATDQVRRTSVSQLGPVTFDANDVPLALTAKESGSSTLVLWDLAKDQPRREFSLPANITGKAEEIALSANGARAAALVAQKDKKTRVILVWDTAAGKVVRNEQRNNGESLALSPDGTLLAAGDTDGRIEVWSIDTGTVIGMFRADMLAVSALAFGPNPRKADAENPWVLASADKGGTVAVWDLTHKLMRAKGTGSAHTVYALAFSPDGTRLASGGYGFPRLWNAVTGQLQLEFPWHQIIGALAFAPDGSHVALGNPEAPFAELRVDIWHLKNGPGLQTLDGLSGQVSLVAFSPDASRVAALSHRWEIGVWDLKTGRLLHVFPAPAGFLADNAAIAISGDNRHLAFTADRKAVLWDLQSAKAQDWSLPPGGVDQLAWDPREGRFISFRMETEKADHSPFSKPSYSEDPRLGQLRTLTPAGPKLLATIKDFNAAIVTAELARNASVLVLDGKRIDATGKTRVLRAYSLPAAEPSWTNPIEWDRPGGLLPLSPDGKHLVYWAWENPIEVRPKLRNLATSTIDELPVDHRHIPGFIGREGEFGVRQGPDSTTLQLYRRAVKGPLVVFSTRLVGTAVQFNLTGTHFAWGTTDGAVIVCNLAETQRRLAAIGLGW